MKIIWRKNGIYTNLSVLNPIVFELHASFGTPCTLSSQSGSEYSKKNYIPSFILHTIHFLFHHIHYCTRKMDFMYCTLFLAFLWISDFKNTSLQNYKEICVIISRMGTHVACHYALTYKPFYSSSVSKYCPHSNRCIQGNKEQNNYESNLWYCHKNNKVINGGIHNIHTLMTPQYACYFHS